MSWVPALNYINLDPRYMDSVIPIGRGPLIAAVLPLFYHIPTLFVIFRIFSVYLETASGKKDNIINPHVMFVIVVHQFTTFFYVISDYVNVRIPATGVLTNWCAVQPPNHLLKFMFWTPIYFSYLAMSFPLLLAILRLIPVVYPTNYESKSRNIVRFSMPTIFLYPFLFTWFNVPGLGVCRPYPPPYSFGAIYIHCIEMWHDIKNAPFLMVNSTFYLILSVVANIILYRRLRKISNQGKSFKLQKAEHSLTLTTNTILLTYFTNFVFLVCFGLFPSYSQYLAFIRSTGSDLEAVMVPWIFYLVHPAFRNQKMFLRRNKSRRQPRISVKTVHV